MPAARSYSLLPLAGAFFIVALAAPALAHPVAENAIDVVIGRDAVKVDVRIVSDEIVLVEKERGRVSTDAEWRAAVDRHAQYVLDHIHLRADGRRLTGAGKFDSANRDPKDDNDPALAPMVPYALRFPLPVGVSEVSIEQDFVREFKDWAAPCVLRIRCDSEPTFDLALLDRGTVVTHRCQQAGAAESQSGQTVSTDVPVWGTMRAYGRHGVMHILTGYDHLLFVTALILAATSFWDLVKVVTAFTLAHTLTLALSVLNIVTVSSRIVEPMISASIVFVAVQNIFWPKAAGGWTRLAVAFTFGLFHGLGFAGGLKDALSQMPSIALWLALIAFSIGVELGHQLVIIPSYSLLATIRARQAEERRELFQRRLQIFGSALIAIAGSYYLVLALFFPE